jgi:hypothetical protein
MRFTDEKKWSDKWFRSLPPCNKIVWIYLCDNCDIAGFYEIDYESIAFHTGLDVDESRSSIEALSRGYIGAKTSDGSIDYIWIKNFLKHQNNHLLNPNNNCHKGIIKRIQMNLSAFPEIPEILGAQEGLFSPTSKSNSRSRSRSNSKSNSTVKSTDEDLAIFEEFRNEYKGFRKKADTEFNNFKKKHKDWKEVLPDLKQLLICQMNQREVLRKSGAFVPEWKHLSTWINNRCWEEEIQTPPKKEHNPF